jgi:hypothetical protein
MIEIRFYCEEDGSCPFKDWLDKQNSKAVEKITGYILHLSNHGYRIRRPHSDYLGSGIYELRPTYCGINYRVLYFFHGREIIIITSGLIKERRIPKRELGIAIRRMKEFRENPNKYSIVALSEDNNWRFHIPGITEVEDE